MRKEAHRTGASHHEIVDRYDPINLFKMIPKLKLEFEPELAELDRLLDDDVFFEGVKADLSSLPELREARTPFHARGSDLEDAGGQAPLQLEL